METKICPSCQKTLPPNVPLGLCPECLIKSGFNTGTEPEDLRRESGFVPPPVDELKKLFPQFEILELIGKGGMGAVYKARQLALDRWVALKILPPGAADDAGFAERFNREARALARLNHPHIVGVHDFGQAGSQPYLVMEFVDGLNLRQVEQAGRLTPEQALEIVPQICEALQFAHNEGIVHRDIKPENILLDKKGRVKITDFGIAKIVGVPSAKMSITGAKDLLGTPHYMAPEQVEKPKTVDHRADIYSLGVVFYELLTGELPLGNFQPPSKRVSVDVRLDEVVLRALEKEPERRYQHANEVKTDVETIAHSAPASVPAAHEPSSAGWLWAFLADRHWHLGILLGLALIAALIFWGMRERGFSEEDRNLRRDFVRLVVDTSAMTFEGQSTTWAGVGALLENVPDRKNTVLEFAVTSDQITVAQQNEWFHKAAALAQQHGFEYASFIGIHPLGSKARRLAQHNERIGEETAMPAHDQLSPQSTVASPVPAAKVTSEQVEVEHLALRMLAAIRDKDDAALQALAVDRIRGWRDALPLFAFEMRERYPQLTGRDRFDMRAGESLVEGSRAVVKCTGPAELKGVYLVLFFVKTDGGWRNWSLRNSPPGRSLAEHLKELPPADASGGPVSSGEN